MIVVGYHLWWAKEVLSSNPTRVFEKRVSAQTTIQGMSKIDEHFQTIETRSYHFSSVRELYKAYLTSTGTPVISRWTIDVYILGLWR